MNLFGLIYLKILTNDFAYFLLLNPFPENTHLLDEPQALPILDLSLSWLLRGFYSCLPLLLYECNYITSWTYF